MNLKSKLRVTKLPFTIIGVFCFAMFGLTFQGCEKEGIIENTGYENNIEQELFYNALFAQENDNLQITITMSSDGEIELVYLPAGDNMSIIRRLKSGNIESNDGWIEYGSVCNKWDAIKFGNKMADIYEGVCYEMKADAPDGDGCRTMYHRPCQ